jgi:hypothetical protein
MACPSSGLNHWPIQSLGSSITPSTEMNRPDTIFLMTVSFESLAEVG